MSTAEQEDKLAWQQRNRHWPKSRPEQDQMLAKFRRDKGRASAGLNREAEQLTQSADKLLFALEAPK